MNGDAPKTSVSKNPVPKTYVVATVKRWNIDAYKELASAIAGEWHLVTDPEDLTVERLQSINPRYIFFPHWSWIVPREILEAFECVCFHMTDVPYGRGGSPLQNLILRGKSQTQLTALRMVEELDAGPVYDKLALSLEGRAEDIYHRAAALCYAHIGNIVRHEPEPQPQRGDVVCFTRRKPEQSLLPAQASLVQLYDHIRMLDAPSYPKAYIDYGEYRINFSHAVLIDGRLEATATLTKKLNENE